MLILEGYRVAFNGTKGWLGYGVVETSPVSGSIGDILRPEASTQTVPETDASAESSVRLVIRPFWGKPVEVATIDTSTGGHGVGGAQMSRDLFAGTGIEPFGLVAIARAGTDSIMVGIAANHSMATGLPVRISDLVV